MYTHPRGWSLLKSLHSYHTEKQGPVQTLDVLFCFFNEGNPYFYVKSLDV